MTGILIVPRQIMDYVAIVEQSLEEDCLDESALDQVLRILEMAAAEQGPNGGGTIVRLAA